jgi:dipeptidyl aminopeptidase/acylaminoacyl peptidase
MAINKLEKLNVTEIKPIDYSVIFLTKIFSKIKSEIEKEELVDFYKQRAEKVNIFEFFYTSNNHKVKAILAEPKELKDKTSTIMYCRGGTGEVGCIKAIHPLIKKGEIFDLVNAGNIVVASQLSGIDGGEGMTDAGGESDIADVMNLYQTFQDYELANNNFALFGGSNGGALIYKILTQTDDFKCAAIIAGKTKELGNKDRPDFEKLKALRYQYYNTNNQEEIDKRSPIQWVDKISKNTPILLLHGTNDWRVNVKDTLEMATKLIENDVPIEMYIYNGDDHSLTNNKEKVKQEIIDWFSKNNLAFDKT